MAVNTYDIGDLVRLRVVFKNPLEFDRTIQDYKPVNPQTVVCRVKRPNSPAETVPVTNPEPGVWVAEVYADAVGTWFYRFEGGGDYVAAAEAKFLVRTSAFSAA